MCLLHSTKSYFLLNCFLLPSVAVRILFGWDSVCVEISHRFLPSPNTNTRMRKTQRILQKQYVVPKTWNDMAVLLKNFSPDFFGKRFIYNFCFSLFLSVWEAIKLDVFENISLTALIWVIMRYKAGMLERNLSPRSCSLPFVCLNCAKYVQLDVSYL